jgi:hypothetical protein
MTFHISRYVEALEDTMNVPLCGIFLVMLSTMCFAAFSAVMVMKLLAHFRIQVTMCIVSFHFNTSTSAVKIF